MGMSQEEIAEIMRKQELSRRATRAAIIKNHAKLAEDMTPEELSDVRALNFDPRGYWQYLWDALWNRR